VSPIPASWWVFGIALALAGAGLVAKQLQVAGLETDLATEKAGRATDRATAESAARAQAEQHRKEAASWRAKQQENANAHQVQVDELLRSIAGLGESRDRLRERVTALAAAASRPPGDPQAQPGGPTAAEAGNLLAAMHRRIDEAAEGIAVFADRASGAGQLCERDYDALTVTRTEVVSSPTATPR
jgi:hypothetical protein